ncbi:MAG: hypothetical protein ACHQIO_24445, partial [Nevskiales bacterium]
MRWLKSEYVESILKGLFLGVLLFAALQEAVPQGDPAEPPGWPALGRVTLFMLGGLVVGLVIAAVWKLREGYKINGRVVAFIVFLLLESPALVYTGIIFGLIAGSNSLRHGDDDTYLWVSTALGGAALGVVFGVLRDVRKRWRRIGLCLLLAVVLGGGALIWLGQLKEPLEQLGLSLPDKSPLVPGADLQVFAVQILLGIPFFYLLSLAGHDEETEVEIGAICAVLGIGLMMLVGNGNPVFKSTPLIVPLGVYLVYTVRVLPGLRVFKHTFRGVGYARAGLHRQSLLALRRALQLAPNDPGARNAYWQVHCALDLDKLAGDAATLALV